MINVRPLRRDDGPAVVAFELLNREYFTRFIADRGPEYFANFDAIHEEIMSEQDNGLVHMHLIVDDDGAVLGRVNLSSVEGGSAELGYRIAEAAAGRGVATEAVRQVCVLAIEYGLVELRAGTSAANVASQQVLLRNGFTPIAHAHGPDQCRYGRVLRP